MKQKLLIKNKFKNIRDTNSERENGERKTEKY